MFIAFLLDLLQLPTVKYSSRCLAVRILFDMVYLTVYFAYLNTTLWYKMSGKSIISIYSQRPDSRYHQDPCRWRKSVKLNTSL